MKNLKISPAVAATELLRRRQDSLVERFVRANRVFELRTGGRDVSTNEMDRINREVFGEFSSADIKTVVDGLAPIAFGNDPAVIEAERRKALGLPQEVQV